MSYCFALTKMGETRPSTLSRIDEHICESLGVPCDDDRYYMDWYDTIGLGIAMGQSPEEIRSWLNPKKWPILEILVSGYEWYNWRKIGR